jgi:O-antigen ligase
MAILDSIGITASGRARQYSARMPSVPAPFGIRKRPRSADRAGITAVVAALAVYIFVIIGRVSDEFPSLHLALVTAGITAALALLGANGDVRDLFRLPESRAVLALFGLAIVAIPFSVWQWGSFAFVTRGYITLVFLFLMIVHCVRSARAVQALFSGVLAAMVFLEISLMLWGTGDRPLVTATYDSNDIAFVMVCGFPVGAMWFLRGRGPGRYIAGLISALAVVTVLLTRSRGGLIGLCIVIGLLLVTAASRQRLGAVTVVLACVLLVGIFSSKGYWNRMATIWGGGERTATVSDEYDTSGIWGARWPIWQTALQLMLEHPLIGVGPGAFDVAEGRSHGGKGKWSTAHNAFLQIGAELGIPGLALFLFLLYRGVKNCRRVIRLARQRPELAKEAWLARSVELSLYGFIVVGFGLSQAYSSIPYLLVATSAVLTRLAVTPPIPRAPLGSGSKR